jgi:hypothetical protein
MTVDSAITKAYLHAMRKPTAPSSGTTKYNALLAIADSMQKLWAAEPGIEWDKLYSLVSLASVVSATDTFALDSTIDKVSERQGDYILVTNGTNTCTVRIVSPDQLYDNRYKLAAARIGSNIKFSAAFASDSTYIGYTIKVPAFVYPNDITSGSDTVQVPDPMWLVYMMAAEYIRNDVVKQNQYDNLLALAEQHMTRMKENNGGQQLEVSHPWAAQGESW